MGSDSDIERLKVRVDEHEKKHDKQDSVNSKLAELLEKHSAEITEMTTYMRQLTRVEKNTHALNDNIVLLRGDNKAIDTKLDGLKERVSESNKALHTRVDRNEAKIDTMQRRLIGGAFMFLLTLIGLAGALFSGAFAK